MTTNQAEFSAYSDASSSYWPPGWNFARFARATPADNATLSDEERAKMQAGFRDVLGEEGVAEMARVVWQEQLRVMRAEKEKKDTAGRAPAVAAPPPEWLKTWRKRYRSPRKKWGFVGLWTAAAVSAAERMVDSGSSSGGVEEFQRRVSEVVGIPFEAALEQGQSAEEVEDARKAFEIRWDWLDNEEEKKGGREVKAEDMSNTELIERLRARYRSIQKSGSISHGQSLPVFLVVSPSAVTSVLSFTSEEKPGTTSRRWRSRAPFLLAVAAEEEQGIEEVEEADRLVGRGGEKDWFKPVFRVAVEVMVDELWPVLDEQITTLGRMTRFVQRAEVTEGVLTGGDGQGEADEDGLDAIWWSVHTPPHQMRKRRRLFGGA
ncbi:uncharacterized protein BDW70DRAFT_143725 [Aspergillus foveolatus]|uniref:uncharacterized protein n=1 Tax=Aspergillus foveolatus TaxID=210207 RepID=UPI003CCE299A